MAINFKQLQTDTLNDIKNVYNECLQDKYNKIVEIENHKKNINKFAFNLKYYFRILNVLKSELNDINEQLAFYNKWYRNQKTFKLEN